MCGCGNQVSWKDKLDDYLYCKYFSWCVFSFLFIYYLLSLLYLPFSVLGEYLPTVFDNYRYISCSYYFLFFSFFSFLFFSFLFFSFLYFLLFSFIFFYFLLFYFHYFLLFSFIFFYFLLFTSFIYFFTSIVLP